MGNREGSGEERNGHRHGGGGESPDSEKVAPRVPWGGIWAHARNEEPEETEDSCRKGAGWPPPSSSEGAG